MYNMIIDVQIALIECAISPPCSTSATRHELEKVLETGLIVPWHDANEDTSDDEDVFPALKSV